MAADPKEIEAFNAAMTELKTAMFALGLHSTGLVQDDPASLRRFAHHVGKLAKSFDSLMDAGGDLVAAEASWDHGAARAAEDFASEINKQARGLEADEDERRAEGRWERQHRQVYDPPRD